MKHAHSTGDDGRLKGASWLSEKDMLTLTGHNYNGGDGRSSKSSNEEYTSCKQGQKMQENESTMSTSRRRRRGRVQSENIGLWEATIGFQRFVNVSCEALSKRCFVGQTRDTRKSVVCDYAVSLCVLKHFVTMSLIVGLVVAHSRNMGVLSISSFSSFSSFSCSSC